MKKAAVENPMVKNIVIGAVILVVIALFIQISQSSKKSKMEKMGGAAAVSVNLEGIQHGVTKLTQSNADYLKNSEYYGGAYAQGKTIVVYPPLGNASIASKPFEDALSAAMDNPKYTANYVFIPFPQTANNQFFENCHSICFVNSKKQELFYIQRASSAAAEKLPFILDGLMSW